MAQFQVVDHFRIGPGGAEICLIENTVPGKKPVCFQFKGNWARAEVEAKRLNDLAATAAQYSAIHPYR
jgi:hypothetical protein